jgi:hypothetical protein
MSKVLQLNEASEYLSQTIKNTQGGWSAGKIGTSELNALLWFLTNRLKNKQPYPALIKKEMTLNAGLWAPNSTTLDETLDSWSVDMLEALENIDAVVSWSPSALDTELALLEEKAPNAKKIVLRALEPYYSPQNQYTLQITQGPIAVISPFAESMEKQWSVRANIFPQNSPAGPMWLPNQELIPIKAAYGPHMTPTNLALSWSPTILEKGYKEALNQLTNQVIQSGAKYAFVGIGALSLPLVNRLKQRNIIAIHTGGGTQIMFGLKGKRWLKHSIISTFFNTHWTNPSDKEIPSAAHNVEGGCYW